MLEGDKILHNGWLKVVGRTINNRNYEVITMDGAVAVLIVNHWKTKMLLVKQFRPAVMNETWEIVVGMLDIKGEPESECAARETEEETGEKIPANKLKLIASYFPMIGSCDHKVSIFLARLKSTKLKDFKDADVTEAKWFTLFEVEDMIKTGQICDGKTNLAFSIFLNNYAGVWYKVRRKIRNFFK